MDTSCRAVRRQTAGHNNLGITLSGGLDSRVIAACAHRLGLSLMSFTWGATNCWDRRIAMQVAEVLNFQHQDRDYAVDRLPDVFDSGVNETEGMCNLFDMHFLLHRELISQADVILNGFAGGGVLGGVFLRPGWLKQNTVDRLAKLVFQRFNSLIPIEGLQAAVPASRDVPKDRFPDALMRSRFAELASMRSPDAAHRFLFENHIRRKTGMGTVLMRAVSESQACFFDYDLIDIITRIPASLRADHAVYKHVLRQVFPEVAGLTWQGTLLPATASPKIDLLSKVGRRILAKLEKIANWEGPTRKQPVARFPEWLRTDWKNWIDEYLHSPHPISEEVLAPEYYRRLWKEHLLGQDHTRQLGVIVPILGFSHALQGHEELQTRHEMSPNKCRMRRHLRDPVRKTFLHGSFSFVQND